MESKIFTYDEACALIEDIRAKTESANRLMVDCRRQLAMAEDGSEEAKEIQAGIAALVGEWSNDILETGALPKGLWTVDFDSGQGFFYCWALGESNLEHYHDYSDGFRGRKPLTPIQQAPPSHLLN